jgi:predicted phosphodiesterase
MVTGFWKYFLPVLALSVFPLSGCDNDLFGMFGSTDLDIRWQARNTFNFLSSPTDRSISLANENDYFFMVVSDTHIDGSTRGLKNLKSVIDDNAVQFVVFNGDITQNGKRKDIDIFIDIAESLGVPCYPVVGNHDVFFGNWPVWKDRIGSTCYRVNAGSATLLFLDSANAYLGAKQIDWLDNELKKAPGRVFVFSHVNLFLDGKAIVDQFSDVRERARIVSLLKGRCDIMFAGHTHERLIREAGGVQYITIEDYRDNAVYCLVRVTKDRISWEFKKL